MIEGTICNRQGKNGTLAKLDKENISHSKKTPENIRNFTNKILKNHILIGNTLYNFTKVYLLCK